MSDDGHSYSPVRCGNRGFQSSCSCGWLSPVVFDRRTADQAWASHSRQTRRPPEG